MNQEIEEFYKTLLSTKEEPGDDDNSDKLFQDKLSDEEHQDLEYDISKEELLNVLKGLNDNKTPGNDGFTKEFYETFFEFLGDRMLNSFKEAFGKGKLSISQRRWVISLIPKDENYLVVLTNWRPITLLNVDYKILARLIAKRIEPKLPTLIHYRSDRFC